MNAKTKAKSSAGEMEPAISQEQPTSPAMRDENGYELDEYNLPRSGPARAAKLTAMGRPDPYDDPKAWRGFSADLTASNTATNEDTEIVKDAEHG